jgi:hypothetical protein
MYDNDKPTLTIIGSVSGATTLHLLAALHGEVARPTTIKDPVSAPPIVSGPHGRAWLCDVALIQRSRNIKPEYDALLADWIVEAPWAHPAWHSYAVVLVHLRPVPDRETKFYLDGATHELWVLALDPNKDRNKILIGRERKYWLQPINFAAQFIEPTDELALTRVRAAVQEICDGVLCPDTDFIRQWATRFGDNMMQRRA